MQTIRLHFNHFTQNFFAASLSLNQLMFRHFILGKNILHLFIYFHLGKAVHPLLLDNGWPTFTSTKLSEIRRYTLLQNKSTSLILSPTYLYGFNGLSGFPLKGVFIVTAGVFRFNADASLLVLSFSYSTFSSSFMTTLDFDLGVSLFLRIVLGVLLASASFVAALCLLIFFFLLSTFSAWSVFFSREVFRSSSVTFSSTGIVKEEVSRGFAPVVWARFKSSLTLYGLR